MCLVQILATPKPPHTTSEYANVCRVLCTGYVPVARVSDGNIYTPPLPRHLPPFLPSNPYYLSISLLYNHLPCRTPPLPTFPYSLSISLLYNHLLWPPLARLGRPSSSIAGAQDDTPGVTNATDSSQNSLGFIGRRPRGSVYAARMSEGACRGSMSDQLPPLPSIGRRPVLTQRGRAAVQARCHTGRFSRTKSTK